MRTTAQHNLNKKSNRSHSIFTVYVTQRAKSGVSEKVAGSSQQANGRFAVGYLPIFRPLGVRDKTFLSLLGLLLFIENIIKTQNHHPFEI